MNKTYTWEEIENAIDSHKNKIIENINKQEGLGVSDAVDLTSRVIQIGKVDQANEALKNSIKFFLMGLT